jgi:hypothetical protein
LTAFRKLDGTLGAQRYDVNGAAAGTEFAVVSGAGSGVGQPACCGGDFGFVVAWADYVALDIGVRVSPRRPSPRYSVRRQHATLSGKPEVACNDDGRFVVVWDSGFAGRKTATSGGLRQGVRRTAPRRKRVQAAPTLRAASSMRK